MKDGKEHTIELLKNLQANIIKPHSREHSWYIFIKFLDVNPQELRYKISLCANNVTSAFEQWKNAIAFKEFVEAIKSKKENRIEKDTKAIKTYMERYEDEVMVNFCLSFAGYKKLRLKTNDYPKDTSFRNGIKNKFTQNILNDPIEEWEPKYQKNIDALIIIAHDSEDRLKKSIDKIKFILKGVAEIISDEILPEPEIEKGKKLRRDNNKNNPLIEHFGFPDGISQPVFWDENNDLIERNLNLVLVKDSENGYGSYLVFRKLEQDVRVFNMSVKKLARRLYETDHPSEEEIEKVEAQVVGRFKKDGTPLTLYNEPKRGKSKLINKLNSLRDKFAVGHTKGSKFGESFRGEEANLSRTLFDGYNPSQGESNLNQAHNGYEKDKEGLKCPFHSHIRKANPRLTESNDQNKLYLPYVDDPYLKDDGKGIEARIVRRGYPYDYSNDGKGRNPDLNDNPSKDVGLLFVSYQASIEQQFERISGWCNSRVFPNKNETGGKEAGIDPIIGQMSEINAYLTDEMKQQWNTGYDGKPTQEKKALAFDQVIRSKGGEYFFAPSIPFLKNITNL